MPLFGLSSPGPFFGNKVRAFWNLQILGWTAWLGLRGVSGLANGQPFTFLIPQTISAITGFSLSLLLSVCYRALINRRPILMWSVSFGLAVLATVGVFSLFALASGILRFAGGDTGNPLIKGLVDGAFDGIVVTDNAGRVLYANAAYLQLVDATDARDVRPVERVFIGDPDVSEAVYRLLKAAREGRRLQEEVRIAGLAGGDARWLRLKPATRAHSSNGRSRSR